jgi:hypothetical protein
MQSNERAPFPFWFIPTRCISPGFSAVCGGDGAVLARVPDMQEGVAVATVTLGPAPLRLADGSRASPSSSFLSTVFLRLRNLRYNGLFPYTVPLTQPLPLMWTRVIEPLGALSYRLSTARRRAALNALGRSPPILLAVVELLAAAGGMGFVFGVLKGSVWLTMAG